MPSPPHQGAAHGAHRKDRFHQLSPNKFAVGLGNRVISQYLNGKIAWLRNYNCLSIPADYFDEAMERLRQRYLNIPLEAVLHPISFTVQDAVRKQQVAANCAEAIQPPANFKVIALQNQGWVFLFGKNGVWWNGISDSLANKMKEIYAAGHEFKSIALGLNSSWVFLFGHNGFSWIGTLNDLVKKMDEVHG